MHKGSVRLRTDPTDQVLARLRSTPFGVREAPSEPTSLLGFTGEPADPSGDLLYLRARFYHPGLGRFLTPDTLVPDPTNGQAWNRYAYGYNDPINLVDPSGHVPWGIVGRIALAAGVGVGLSLLADGIAGLRPEWNAWWRGKPTCACTPVSPPALTPQFFMGLAPGVALGIALAAGGLSEEVQRSLVPGPHHPTTPSHLAYAQEQAWRYGGASQRYLDELIDTGAARVQRSVNWGLGDGIWGPTGYPHLAADGVMLASGFLDAGLQGFADRSLCLSPRQKFNRALVAGVLGMAAGGVGIAASVARGPVAGIGAALGVSSINEIIVKPTFYQRAGLQ